MGKNFSLSVALGLLATACSAPPRAAAPAAPAAPIAADVEPAPPDLAQLLKRIETAYRGGNYALGLSLVKQALELENNDVSAMDRIGSIYYVLGRYGEALTIWNRALPLERDPQKRRALENSIRVTRRGLGLAEDAFVAAAVSSAAAPPPPRPKPAAKAELSEETKAEVEALYKKGVKYYASGQYLQATTAFLDVLELDPDNADAAKALKRLQLDR
jgi:tetratricopeptide (TPR) repeat protein